MIKRAIYISFFLLLLLLVAKYITNDQSWVIKFYSDNGKNQSRTLIYIKKNDMKLVMKDQTYLYNSNSRTMSFINHKNRTYWSGNVSDFEKAVNNVKTQTKDNIQLNDFSFLKNLKSKDKKYFEETINKRIGQNSPTTDYNIFHNFNIIRTPNFTSVGEYVVRKYEIRNSGELLEEIWIAENLLSHIGWNIVDFKDFLEAFFFHTGILPYFNLNSYMKVRKNGLPLKAIIFNGKEKTIITMDHISKMKLNKNSFSIPENFILKTIDEILTPTINHIQ